MSDITIVVSPGPAPISVTAPTNPTPPSITVATVGVQGPAGDGAGFNFTQAVAAQTWTINHNLGYTPSVTVFDTGGHEVEADVVNTSVNQTLVYFDVATAGSARLI
jgi:hypothetical protein